MGFLHRDYLGSILAITDASGAILEERQFGAWGTVDRFRASDGTTTFSHNSLLGRGYTGHEHFFEVGLIHMNGRMYDAQLGRFLSPDNYVQDPYNTQNFNRYGYVLNNPLMYTDFTGEKFWKSIGNWFKKHSQVITAVVTIGVAVIATVATAGMASPLLAGAIVGASAGFAAGAVGTWTSGGSFGAGLTNGLIQGAIGAVTGVVASGASAWATKNIGSVAINGLKISGSAVKGFVGGVIGGGASGFAGGAVGAALSGANFEDALKAGLKGAAMGAAIGGAVGAGRGFKHAKLNNQNPWTGESLGGSTPQGQTIVGEGMKRVSAAAAKNPGSTILDDMPEFSGSPHEVTSKMMEYNRKWLLQQMRSGRPILDIGLDPTRTNPSIFYQMEQRMISNYLKLNADAFKVIRP